MSELTDRERVTSILGAAVSFINDLIIDEIRGRGIPCTHTLIEITAGGATTEGDVASKTEGWGGGSYGDARPLPHRERREIERAEILARLRVRLDRLPPHLRNAAAEDLSTLARITEPVRLAEHV